MRETFLPFHPVPVGQAEADAVAAVIRSGWITTGSVAGALEHRFADLVGAPGAVALSSCTAALHTALVALGVGPGDEVITTPMTFASTVHVIEQVGATPVLADVEPETLTVDPEAVSRLVTARTKVVLPVHYAGHPAELDALRAIAADASAVVVEDAAHALPATYKGRPIGSDGNPVAFSFYATKNVTSGEGGMLTGEPGLLDDARVIALHGMDRDAWRRYDRGGRWRYEVVRAGFKYNLPDVLAAIATVQLDRLPGFQERRRAIAATYDDAFSGHPGIRTPVVRPYVESAWHLYVLRVEPDELTIGRDRFIDELAARNIGTSVHFVPIDHHPYFAGRFGWAPGSFPVAAEAFSRIISLPLSPALSDEDVSDVIEAVTDVASAFRR